MAKHRTFHADKFLDKFQGNEPILRAFLKLWKKQLGIDATKVDVPSFKEWLHKGKSEAKNEVIEELHRVYDLCGDNEFGIATLLSIAERFKYFPDPNHELHIECLSMKMRAEKEEVFNLAYDNYSMARAERYSVYCGKEALAVSNVAGKVTAFKTALERSFTKQKNTDRVLVRWFIDGDSINVIVYHEKRTKATLLMKRNKSSVKVFPNIHRPAQQDFICYNNKTGWIEIEASNEKEEATLRRTFAKHFLSDEEFFDYEGANKCLAFEAIANTQFSLNVPTGEQAKLVELHFGLDQDGEPFLPLRSDDVLRTLDINGLRNKLVGDKITRAVFRILFPGEKRPKRVEVYAGNRMKFNRSSHVDDIFRLLREWGILREREDIAELYSESFSENEFADHSAA